MRGTHAETVRLRAAIGIIPAHAGNTFVSSLLYSSTRDHPRACGEHYICEPRAYCRRGSSPRMRGTQAPRHCQGLRPGIIPAHAGNTVSAISSLPPNRDHPRACGEHYGRYSLPTASVGSSPRMRGTLSVYRGRARWCGIIPAHAGNTACRAGVAVQFRDHPRACGEHPDIELWHTAWVWIIPAHAGNTISTLYNPRFMRDHPRACGEH